MKKLLILILMFAGSQLFAQPWKTIKGNGNLKKETRTVADFTSLSSHGPMDVKIVYGNSNSIQVEADENLLPYIETNVENGKAGYSADKEYEFKIKIKNGSVCFHDENKYTAT